MMRWSEKLARTAFYQLFMIAYSKVENCLSQQNFCLMQELKTSSTLIKECVLKANRVIVPVKLKDKVLQMLHSEHMGISKTKNLARPRYYVWWPKIDEYIECLVKSCEPCQLNRNDPEKHSSH